ncbi:hypothetical protein HDV57DRAFT_332003 [Trichoderma longibrachiatum]
MPVAKALGPHLSPLCLLREGSIVMSRRSFHTSSRYSLVWRTPPSKSIKPLIVHLQAISSHKYLPRNQEPHNVVAGRHAALTLQQSSLTYLYLRFGSSPYRMNPNMPHRILLTQPSAPCAIVIPQLPFSDRKGGQHWMQAAAFDKQLHHQQQSASRIVPAGRGRPERRTRAQCRPPFCPRPACSIGHGAGR